MDIRTILVPVDFSTCSFSVAGQAGELAAKLGARVVILHVTELPPGLSADARVDVAGEQRVAAAYLSADARARLDRFTHAVRALGVDAESLVEIGPIVPTVVAVADRMSVDLVVMGTHGRTGLARLMLGSVAEGVLHRVHAPVMLVRREPRPECGRQSCAWCAEGGTQRGRRAHRRREHGLRARRVNVSLRSPLRPAGDPAGTSPPDPRPAARSVRR
jgi:universal stress protein A